MARQQNLTEEELDVKIYNNIYPDSNYFKGQKVMVQKNRQSSPDNLSFCPGIINTIYSNNTYLIEFPNNQSKIISKKYFYAETTKNTEELVNYQNALNTVYGIGAEVEADINYHNDNPPDIQKGKISGGEYENKIFNVTFENGQQISNIPIEHIYNSCNLYFTPIMNPTIHHEEEEEETHKEIKIEKTCQELRFDSLGFLMQNKKTFGILTVIISLICFLLIVKKIFINHSLFGNLKFKEIIDLVFNIIFILISLILILLIIILANKKLVSLKAIIIYSFVFIFITFLFNLFKDEPNLNLFSNIADNDNDIFKFVMKIIWSIVLPMSFGPVYLILYFLFIIPNYIFNLLNYDNLNIDFLDYIYAKRPAFLSTILYFVVIAIFFTGYIMFLAYAFDDYIDVPKKYSQYDNLTTSLLFRLKQIFTSFKNFVKNNSYTIIYLSCVVVYIFIKYYIPKTGIYNNRYIQKFVDMLPLLNTKTIVYLVIFYFLLKFIIWKIWPALRRLNFQQLLKDLHLTGFVRGLEDANQDITTQQLDLKNLPPTQI